MGGGPIWPETVLYAQDLFPEQFRSLFDQKISAEEEHHPPSSLGATVNRLTRISCVFQVLYKICRRMRDNSLEITCCGARCQERNSHASPPGSWCSREQTNNPMSRLPFSHLHILIEFQWLICPGSNIVPWLISWNNQPGLLKMMMPSSSWSELAVGMRWEAYLGGDYSHHNWEGCLGGRYSGLASTSSSYVSQQNFQSL